MNNESRVISRRAALVNGGLTLAGIVVTVIATGPAAAADAKGGKKKAKASKDDFYFQDTPNDDGRSCLGCINFTPKATGLYGDKSGDCGLLEGDVCTHCFCQGWTDKNAAGAKRAGT
jgi:hypothetical protein